MSSFVPVWILGAPFVALLVLNAMFSGGSSAARNEPGSADFRRPLS
jgi:hypothetical protein